jgi:outer membrane receptor for ferrienterochelin and colicins
VRHRLPLCLGLCAVTWLPLAQAQEEKALEEVVVRVDRDDHSRRRDSSATRIVYGRTELEAASDSTVGDYLRKLPGVVLSGSPGRGREARMRGMKGATQILIDGEKAGGGKDRSVDVDQLPLDLIERIEVIRTPTADLPNEGIAGTINIVLREAPEQAQRSLRLGAGLSRGEADSGRPWQISGLWGDRSEQLRWLFNASYNEREEPATGSKTVREFDAAGSTTARRREENREQLKTREFNFAPRLDWRDGADRYSFSPMLQLREGQRDLRRQLWNGSGPDFATYTGNGSSTESEHKTMEALHLRGQWQRRLEQGRELSFSASTRTGIQHQRALIQDYDAAGTLNKTTRDETEAREQSYRWQLKGQRPVGELHLLSLGLENEGKRRVDERLRLENGVPVATAVGDSVRVREQVWAGFMQDEVELNAHHTVVAGLRLTHIRQEAEAANGTREASYANWAPSLHHRWAFAPDQLLRSSLTRSVKPPRFDDLSPQVRLATGVAPGSYTNPDKAGNPDLRPEQAMSLEMGWERYLPARAGTLGANFFWRHIDDVVEKRRTLESGRYVERPYNSGTAQVWGLEFDTRTRLDALAWPELTLRANYTRLYSRVQDSETGTVRRLKEQPGYIANLGADWRRAEWTLGGNYNHVPALVRDPLTGATENAQSNLDLYVLRQLNRQLALRLNLYNVLNAERIVRKPGYDNSGTLNADSLETQRGARQILLALEGKW